MTSSLVTGLASEARELAERWEAMAESMEGAAAAHICALYGMPFLEVRGISNLVGDRDRAAWEVQTGGGCRLLGGAGHRGRAGRPASWQKLEARPAGGA